MANQQTKDDWLNSIQTLLKSVDYDYIQSCSISVVPESLKKLNEDAYMPRVVSIGPRFKGSRDDLLLMEEVKLRCMLSLLHRGAAEVGDSLKGCIEAVWELDQEVRASYVTHIELQQHELGNIMLLDGCFLLELLISKGLDSEFPSCLWPPGPATEVLKNQDVLSDLMLFENQIPILVLHKLSQTLFPNVFEPDLPVTDIPQEEDTIETEEERMERLRREKKTKREPRAKKINNLALSVLGYSTLHLQCLEAPHILDLVHFFVNGKGERRIDNHGNHVLGITDTTATEKLKLNSCALSLQAAGVSIEVLEDRDKGISCCGLIRNYFGGVLIRIGNFIVKTKHRNATVSQVKGLNFHFKFENGKLKIEQLHITETTKAKWRNIIVWEHHKKKGKSSSISDATEDHRPSSKFTLSALIFDGLICCSADVKFLKEKNIIVDHTNMSNEKLKEFFHTIASGIDSGILDSSYVKLVDDLNNYSGAFVIIRILKELCHGSAYCLEWLIKFLKQNYNFVAALLAILNIVNTSVEELRGKVWRMGLKREEEAIHRLDDKLQFAAATIPTWCGNKFQTMNYKNKDSQSSQGTQSSTINKPTQEIDGSVAGNPLNLGWSKSNKAMKVSLEMKNGEYVLKLKTGMTDQAQTAAMLSSQAVMLRRLGETLIFLSEFFKSLG